MQIITRSEAITRGLDFYFTGKPCKHGHIAKRRVSSPQCHACKMIAWRSPAHKDRMRRYQNRPEEKRFRRDRMLRATYGISIEQMEAMLQAQGGRCAICIQVLELGRGKRGMSVDHCHGAGHVRGILCNCCNRALGLFDDSPDVLMRAALYLKEAGRAI